MIKGILLLLIILMFISIYLRKLIPDSLMYGPIGTIIELIQEFGNWAFFIGGLWVLWFIWGKFKKKKDVSGPTINIHNNNQAQQQRAQQQTQQQNAKQQTRKKIQRDVTFQNRLGRQARIKELRAKKAKKDALKKQNQQKDANQPQPPRNPVG